jgi:hypothetical protein
MTHATMADDLTKEEMAELERLLEGAAKGPWTVNYRFGQKTTINARQRFIVADTATAPHGEANTRREEANAALIVAAVNALPALLFLARRAETAEAALQEAREVLEPFARVGGGLPAMSGHAALEIIGKDGRRQNINDGHFRRARSFLHPKGGGDG